MDPKERQALKLAEIREALVSAGYDTTAKQAAVWGGPKHGLVVTKPRQEIWSFAQSHQTHSFIAANSQESTPKSRAVRRAEDPRPLWAQRTTDAVVWRAISTPAAQSSRASRPSLSERLYGRTNTPAPRAHCPESADSSN